MSISTLDGLLEAHDRPVLGPGVEALNLAFDVTPAEYITAIITERGVFKPSDLVLRFRA